MPSLPPRSVRIDATFGCPGCGQPIVVAAIVERVRCRACLREVALDRATWTSFLRQAIARAVDGEGGRSTNFDRHTYVTRIAPVAPTCICGQPLVDGGCSCGRVVPLRPVTWEREALHDDLVGIIGERPDPPITAQPPVAFRCRCGASLRTDGTSRAVRCAACGDVDVPPALWDALHPTQPAPGIYAILEADA